MSRPQAVAHAWLSLLISMGVPTTVEHSRSAVFRTLIAENRNLCKCHHLSVLCAGSFPSPIPFKKNKKNKLFFSLFSYPAKSY